MKIFYGVLGLFLVALMLTACSSSNADNSGSDNGENENSANNMPDINGKNEPAQKDETANGGTTASTKISMDKIYNYASVKTFEYKMTTNAQGVSNTANMKYAISERAIDGKDAWLVTVDMTTQGAEVTSKTWLNKATYACIKSSSVVTFNGQQMETPVECPKEGPNSVATKEIPQLDYLGSESVTVPAGTYTAKKYLLDNLVTYWYADSVPIPVKVEFKGGEQAMGGTSVSELVSWS